MAIYNKVNNEIHETHVLNVKVNGEWKQGIQFTKVNGEWKQVHSHYLNPDSIIGFRMIYKRCGIDKKHPELTHLFVNYDLPINIRYTGDVNGNMDMSAKGIIFEYFSDKPESEGILMYEGRLFAVLENNILIDTGSDDNNERIPSIIQGIDEYWNCNRLSNVSIKIDTTLQYEANGRYIAGWNGMFSDNHFMDQTDYSIKVSDKQAVEIISDMLPIASRDKKFNNIATIGIARDVTSKFQNMIGSYGYLDQTIHKIFVNGIQKPFTCEIYR